MIEELVKRAQDDDISAFEEIIKRYEKKVYNLSLRYLKNHDDALDAAQDVFLQVYGNLKQFRGDAQFSTWIYRITYNKCIDMLRKNRSVRENVVMSTDDENFFETQQDKGSIESDYESKEALSRIMDMIDELPREQRDVMILRYLKDLSYAQVGEVLGVAEGTVKSRLNRARLKIKSLVCLDGTKCGEMQSKK